MGRRSGVPHRSDEWDSLSLSELDKEIAGFKLRLKFMRGKVKETGLRKLAAFEKLRETKLGTPKRPKRSAITK